MDIKIVEGDLLSQNVDVIVNAWNVNTVSWPGFRPAGVSGAILKRAGDAPFDEISRRGPMDVGDAVLTTAGNLSHKGIIHLAGIDARWKATRASIQDSTCNAVRVAAENGYRSIAFPLIGSGVGAFNEAQVLDLMQEALETVTFDGEVRLVQFAPPAGH